MTNRQRAGAGSVLAIVVLGAGFGWGFASARFKGFPYSIIRHFLRVSTPATQIRSTSPDLAQLRSIPYLSGSYDPQYRKSGVVIYDSKRAWNGLTYFDSGNSNHSTLIDMRGHVLHQWRLLDAAHWSGSKLLPNGDVIVALEDKGIVRIDSESKELWRYPVRSHHDVWSGGDSILTLSHEPEVVPAITPLHPSLVDYITVLSPDGKLRDRFSLLDILQRSPYAFLLPQLGHLRPGIDYPLDRELDVLHTNHLEVFDGSLESRSPLFTQGNILVSMRNINSILILDGHTHQILWLWGPTNLAFQHDPTLLANGHILLFDNGTVRSQVLEVDPLSTRIVWRYAPEKGFFSATKGANQRLPNGNTLVTESDAGYGFEVTPAGEVVWELANPDVDRRRREVIWQIQRFQPGDLPFVHPDHPVSK